MCRVADCLNRRAGARCRWGRASSSQGNTARPERWESKWIRPVRRTITNWPRRRWCWLPFAPPAGQVELLLSVLAAAAACAAAGAAAAAEAVGACATIERENAGHRLAAGERASTWVRPAASWWKFFGPDSARFYRLLCVYTFVCVSVCMSSSQNNFS